MTPRLLIPGLTLAFGLLWAVVAGRDALSRGDTSDLSRQRLVAQRIRAGENPYPVARNALDGLMREAPPGVPEATYPPPASALFALTFGAMSQDAALWACLLLNLAAMAYVVVKSAELAAVPWPVAAWLAFFFLPFYHAVAAGQLALLVFVCLLHACGKSSTWSAGLALAVALVKPSIALPFLVIPIMRRRWGVLLIAAAVQGTLFAGLALWLGASPVSLLSDWLAVAGHFMVSFFGIQYPLLHLQWVGTPMGTACTLGALALLLLAAWSAKDHAFPFLCLGCLLWTYHLGYDFVAQFPVVLILGSALGWRLSGFTGTLLFVAVCNLAYFPPAAWMGTPTERVSDAAWLLVFMSHPLLLGWLWRFPVAIPAPSCDNQ